MKQGSSDSTRNDAIVIGATCGLLGGFLVLIAAMLAVMARRHDGDAVKVTDSELAAKGALSPTCVQ